MSAINQSPTQQQLMQLSIATRGISPTTDTDQHNHHSEHDKSKASNAHNQHQSDSSYSSYTSFSATYTSYSYLRRVMLSNTSVTCNDGTVAGYYIRRSFGSRRWIVFLEGGWYCFSAITCHQRWQKMRSLMTSAHWPEAKTGMSFNVVMLFCSSLELFQNFYQSVY